MEARRKQSQLETPRFPNPTVWSLINYRLFFLSKNSLALESKCMGWVYFLSYLHEKGSKVNTGLTIPRKEVLLMQASINCLADSKASGVNLLSPRTRRKTWFLNLNL